MSAAGGGAFVSGAITGIGEAEGFVVEAHPASRKASAITASGFGYIPDSPVYGRALGVQFGGFHGKLSGELLAPRRFRRQTLAGVLFGGGHGFGTGALHFGAGGVHGGNLGLVLFSHDVEPPPDARTVNDNADEDGPEPRRNLTQHNSPPAPSPPGCTRAGIP